jgi:S1-C subfamily serine protease
MSVLMLLNVALLVGVAWLMWSFDQRVALEASGIPRAVSERGALPSEEETTVQIFERVKSSVVYITTLAHRPVRRHFFGLDVERVQQGRGSGIVWDKRGHIVTNFHVIADAEEAVVTFADGSEWTAQLVGHTPDHDLAVLQVDAPEEHLSPIPIGTSRDLRVGQQALVIGNPFGLDQTLTTGVISALDREIDAMSDRTIYGVIQTDAAVNPGNSGGPLLDSSGLLVGVNTAIHSPSGDYTGIGFAVPVDTVNRIVPQLIRYGRAARPGLGVLLVSDRSAARLGIKGVAIRSILPRGPAAKTGLEGIQQDRWGRLHFGDVIVAVNGKRVAKVDDLLRHLDTFTVGEKVTLRLQRDGAEREVLVTLQAMD